MPDERSAGAVVFRMEGGKPLYLLLHYAAGHWDFVKGKVEGGESGLETAVREAREEAGLRDLVFREGFREGITYVYKRGGKAVHKEVLLLLAETRAKEITLSPEHTGCIWLPYAAAHAKLTYENAKRVLEKADRFLVRL